MRLRVRHLCLALIPVAVILAFAVGDDMDRHYCTSCGLVRLSEFRTCFGIASPRTTRYRETEFHLALLSTGCIECSHRWQAFYRNHHDVRPGEIHIPFVLTDNGPYAYLLHRISRLEDPDKRFVILTSFDLMQLLEENFTDTDPAFEELRTVSGGTREQLWWTKYAHLFISRLRPNPALRRTGSASTGSGISTAPLGGPGR
jgi:hypothetical protein